MKKEKSGKYGFKGEVVCKNCKTKLKYFEMEEQTTKEECALCGQYNEVKGAPQDSYEECI